MTGPGGKFSRKQESAIAALLSHPTLTEAAAACSISERTLRRWLQNEAFARHYQRERSRILESTANLLRQRSVAAVATLAAVADDLKSPAGARVSAARSIIEFAIRSAEMQDLETRINELEQLAKERRP